MDKGLQIAGDYLTEGGRDLGVEGEKVAGVEEVVDILDAIDGCKPCKCFIGAPRCAGYIFA